MAGSRVEIRLTQTNDEGDIIDAQSSIKINGYAKFFSAIKVAQLSLKHRQNKQQRMRIIAFCGHPLQETVQECEDLGRRLRRNNVALDVINFANPGNKEKLQAVINACNNDNNSHFLDVE